MGKYRREVDGVGSVFLRSRSLLLALSNCKLTCGVAGAGIILLMLFFAVSCKNTEKHDTTLPQYIATLYMKLHSGAGEPDIQEFLAKQRNTRRIDPNWPALTYLVGETYLKTKDDKRARVIFRELAVWAASDQSKGPYKDGWGVSGLSVIGLWRWLQILDEHGGTAEEVDQALKVAAALQRTRLFAGMVQSGLLPSLPLLEEDVARLLAHIAWKANRPEAMALFLDFVSIDSTGELDPTDEKIRRKMLDEGLASPERWELFRCKRQLNLVKSETLKRSTAEKLKKLWGDRQVPAEVRAEAGYEWANYFRNSKNKKKEEIVYVLTTAFDLVKGKGLIAEKALYRRAMVQNSVKPRQADAFYSDMKLLIERFPNSRLADDALYQLATEYLFGAVPDYDQAFYYLEKLRSFEGANDWLDSGYFLAAVGLVDRGTDADLKAADLLLKNYVEQFPDGVYRRRSLFWRGRIAERNNDTKSAQRFYHQIIAEAPYDYYGLRASMHLECGAKAISMALPQVNSKSWGKLREVYRRSVPDVDLSGFTPYHERLRGAVQSGLYTQLLAIVNDLGKRFHNRLDNIPLQVLDKNNLIPTVALQLALRQDALAACDSAITADNQLRLVGFLGRKVADWPVAIEMTFVRGDAPRRHIAELQNDPRFLATVYPSIEVLKTLREPLADAAWQIDGSTVLSQCLMYAIIRRESCYFSGAISQVGALGLFQILPSTFDNRPDCWNLRQAGEKPTAMPYLFDPVRNTQFWSCWARRELKPKSRESIALMVVKHHAGVDHLGEWMATWKGRAIEHDLELQIESYRFMATQVLVRNVLTDVAIVEASGFFEVDVDPGQRKTP